MKIIHSLSAVLLTFCLMLTLFGSAFSASAASYTGKGTMASPYLVTNVEQLQGIRDKLSAHYKLANTIDLKGVDFKPIGRLDAPFTGSFVCELNADKTPKYAIKNLKVAVAEKAYSAENKNKWEAALFGATSGATISGIYVFDAHISNQNFGANTGSVIYNDYKPGMNEMNSAILIGKAVNSTITQCGTTGTIDSRSSYCAGLIGYALNSTIENCYSTANVTTAGLWSTGGLIGKSENSIVSSCFATGNVKGSNSNSGFSGSALGGSFTDCYSTGNILSKAGFAFSSLQMNIKVTNCFALGTQPTAASSVGDWKVTAKNFWCTDSKAASNRPGLTAGDKAAIKAAFKGLANWDTAGDYPKLKNVGVVTDVSKYQPGTIETSSGSSTSSTPSGGATDPVGSQVATPGESIDKIVEMIKALPDPDTEGAVTLDCKESVMKAYAAYETLGTGEKDDFDATLAAKLNKVRYQVSLLMVPDVVTRIQKLPETDKLAAKDAEDILALWKDYTFLEESIKKEIDKEVVEKMEGAYAFAKDAGKSESAGSVVTIENGLTSLEWVIVIFCAVVIVLAISFDVFAGIFLIRKKKQSNIHI